MRRSARPFVGTLVGLGLLAGLIGPAASSSDPVADARARLAAATAERESAERRVADAEARLGAARTEADRLHDVDRQLTEDLAAARRDLREYAIAAYIDGGQSELFRATLNAEQAQALAWQSSMMLGQSVSAEEAAQRYETLKSRNEPEALAAATEVDRATSAVQEAQFDLIQTAAFERDAEAEVARAVESARREAAARAAAERAARAAAAAEAAASVSAAKAPEPSAAGAPAPSTATAFSLPSSAKPRVLR